MKSNITRGCRSSDVFIGWEGVRPVKHCLMWPDSCPDPWACIHMAHRWAARFANELHSYSQRSRVQILRLLFLHWIPFSLLRCLCTVHTAVKWSKLFPPMDKMSFSFFFFFLLVTTNSMKISVEWHLFSGLFVVTKEDTDDQFSLLCSKRDKSLGIAFEISPFPFHSVRLISA